MTDFTNYEPGLESPPSRGAAVTPSDSTDLDFMIRGLMVTSAGNVSVVTTGGDTVTLPSLQPGLQYAILATRVRATGTTATGIVGFA